MNRKWLLALAAALLLLGTGRSLAGQSASTMMFCPECWFYLSTPGSADMKGNCAACGKYPVELEVTTLKWFWCSSRTKWLDEPCENSTTERCCREARSLAIIVPPSRQLEPTWYCPLDSAFETFQLPLLKIRACRSCGTPALSASAMRRAWYWCDLEGTWGTEPCSMSPVKKCCAKFEGLLLAKPEMGPIAK